MPMDTRDFGFKTGDTMRATLEGQPARNGTVVWLPEMGMCLEWSMGRTRFHSRLTVLHDAGWHLALVKRPLLDDPNRAVMNILDDPNLHFAFRDELTAAQAFTDRAMARVGANFPVIALPTAAREQFEQRSAMVDATIRVYDGLLPGEEIEQ